MLHKNHLPGSPEDWLRYAHSDLAIARAKDLSPEVLLEELCFHAQQVVEKSLKALLVAKGIPFFKTHNIRVLLDLLPQDIVIPSDVEKAASLTEYAVMSRYPEALEPVEEEEYKEAVHLAEFVITWIEGLLNS